MKIAMWSGPRNLSTACLYSFGNRADFIAWDEPFYGAYLARTGIDHPMRETILSETETDPLKVGGKCAGPVPNGKTHWYMKHMAFHMCDGFPLDWAKECVNVHLIRHPARVVASYTAKRQAPTLRDIGFAEQAAVFERFPGPILDSADIRQNPEGMLRKLCDMLGLGFDPAMLTWSPGPKPFDGVWASHWYGAVHRSTGFAGPEGDLPVLSGAMAALADEAMPYYRALHAERLTLS